MKLWAVTVGLERNVSRPEHLQKPLKICHLGRVHQPLVLMPLEGPSHITLNIRIFPYSPRNIILLFREGSQMICVLKYLIN